MADLNEESSENPLISFEDFPEDVQLAILSFLYPSEIASFCRTSKRFARYTRNGSKLWHSLCDRRWASKTHLSSWSHNGQIPFHLLYKTLHRLDNLIGFWRRIDRHGKPSYVSADTNPPALLFFEWGPSSITASEIRHYCHYDICKKPFLWMGLSPCGDPVNYLHPPVCVPAISTRWEDMRAEKLEAWDDLDLVSVNVSFVGRNHLVVEENQGYSRRNVNAVDFQAEDMGSSDNSPTSASGSPPDQVTSDVYQYFANRTSPWDRAYRRQRRKEKQRQGKRLWEPEHYVKIENPTPAKPLQGLWKGRDCHEEFYFYVVAYDDIGGITCRRIGEPRGHFSGCTPVFWTSNPTFMEPPFSGEEMHLYESCGPVRPSSGPCRGRREVSRIVHINSSYDLVIPNLADSVMGASMTEGRIWQFKDGSFAFGFLREHYFVEMWNLALNGHHLDLDVPEQYCT